jgi:hypothetical protein
MPDWQAFAAAGFVVVGRSYGGILTKFVIASDTSA